VVLKLKIFKCNYCDVGSEGSNSYLAGVNFYDTENVEEIALDVVNSVKFSCDCGAEYQFGLFDLKTNIPLLALNWGDDDD
jgi:hypothetical protein